MARRGTPFAGLLYAGLALTSRGLRVVEFNARFGDPETQAILPLLETGLGTVLHAAATGRLHEAGRLVWKPAASVVVVLAAQGYPGTPAQGGSIRDRAGIVTDASAPPGSGILFTPTAHSHVVHAGTALTGQGDLVAQGGRVLGVAGLGGDLAEARAQAYASVARIDFPSGFCRHDIAQRAAEGLIPTVAAW
jgi:phosphoribosylamine--glycine ligase